MVEHHVGLAAAHGPAVAHGDGHRLAGRPAPVEGRHQLARLWLEHGEIARPIRQQRREHVPGEPAGLVRQFDPRLGQEVMLTLPRVQPADTAALEQVSFLDDAREVGDDRRAAGVGVGVELVLARRHLLHARAALAQQVTAATRYVASGMGTGSAPALVQLVNGIASRFSIPVTQKALAQAAPLIGAATGATLNLIFIGHFQSVARGHFVVRRLEREHGVHDVRAAYARLATKQNGPG